MCDALSKRGSKSIDFESYARRLTTDFVSDVVSRQSIDQVFTTHPACVCLNVILKSIFSYSHTSSSSVRCWSSSSGFPSALFGIPKRLITARCGSPGYSCTDLRRASLWFAHPNTAIAIIKKKVRFIIGLAKVCSAFMWLRNWRKTNQRQNTTNRRHNAHLPDCALLGRVHSEKAMPQRLRVIVCKRRTCYQL